jgi:phosphopantetheine adenylyltransferase
VNRWRWSRRERVEIRRCCRMGGMTSKVHKGHGKLVLVAFALDGLGEEVTTCIISRLNENLYL